MNTRRNIVTAFTILRVIPRELFRRSASTTAAAVWGDGTCALTSGQWLPNRATARRIGILYYDVYTRRGRKIITFRFFFCLLLLLLLLYILVISIKIVYYYCRCYRNISHLLPYWRLSNDRGPRVVGKEYCRDRRASSTTQLQYLIVTRRRTDDNNIIRSQWQ